MTGIFNALIGRTDCSILYCQGLGGCIGLRVIFCYICSFSQAEKQATRWLPSKGHAIECDLYKGDRSSRNSAVTRMRLLRSQCDTDIRQMGQPVHSERRRIPACNGQVDRNDKVNTQSHNAIWYNKQPMCPLFPSFPEQHEQNSQIGRLVGRSSSR